jgi:hypothetical protein
MRLGCCIAAQGASSDRRRWASSRSCRAAISAATAVDGTPAARETGTWFTGTGRCYGISPRRPRRAFLIGSKMWSRRDRTETHCLPERRPLASCRESQSPSQGRTTIVRVGYCLHRSCSSSAEHVERTLDSSGSWLSGSARFGTAASPDTPGAHTPSGSPHRLKLPARMGTDRRAAVLVGVTLSALVLASCGGGSAPSSTPLGNNSIQGGGAPTTIPTEAPTTAVGAQVTVQYHASVGVVPFGFTAMRPQLLPQVGQQPADPGKYWLYIVVDVYNELPDRSATDPSGALRVTTGGCNPNSGTCVDCINQDAAGVGGCTPNYFWEGGPFGVIICASDTYNHNGLIAANSYTETDLCVTQVASMPAGVELWFPDGDTLNPSFFAQYTQIPLPST